MILMNANALVTNSKFVDSGCGVIFSAAAPYNEVVISDNFIENSQVVGICLFGIGAKQLVMRNTVTDLIGVGIKAT